MNVLSLLKNRAARNAGWIVACKLVQAALGLLVSMVTARYLGPSQYGLVSYAVSIATFLTPAAQLGLTATLVHEMIRSPEEEGKILGTSIAMSMLSSLVCILGASLFVSVTNPGEAVTLRVCQLYSLLLLAQGAELTLYWFQTKLLSKYTALTTLVIYVMISLYQILILIKGRSLYLYVISKALEHGMIAAVLLVFYRRLGGQKLRFSFQQAKNLFQRSRHFMLASLMIMAYAQADRIMIRNMIGDAAMGFYAAAVMCANLTDFIFMAIIDSLRPVVLDAKRRNRKAFENGMSALYAIVFYMVLVQSVMITLFARPMILLMCGSEYLPAVQTLRIIVWYTAFSYIGSARSIWITAESKQRVLWMVNLSGAALNIALNLAMIPVWGIEGAAVASLITQIFVNVIAGYLIAPLKGNNQLLLKGLNPKAVLVLLKHKSASAGGNS